MAGRLKDPRRNWYSISVDTLRTFGVLIVAAGLLVVGARYFHQWEQKALAREASRVIDEARGKLDVAEETAGAAQRKILDQARTDIAAAEASYLKADYRAAIESAKRARAALGLTRHDCVAADLTPVQRLPLDQWRAQVLDQVTAEQFAQLPEQTKNRLRLRRAGVWSSLAYQYSRRADAAASTAAQRALAELAAVNKTELSDDGKWLGTVVRGIEVLLKVKKQELAFSREKLSEAQTTMRSNGVSEDTLRMMDELLGVKR